MDEISSLLFGENLVRIAMIITDPLYKVETMAWFHDILLRCLFLYSLLHCIQLQRHSVLQTPVAMQELIVSQTVPRNSVFVARMALVLL